MLLLDRDRETPVSASPGGADADALFEEARRRQRRRWALRVVIAAVVLAASAAITALAFSGAAPRGASAAGAGARVALPTGPLATLRVAGPLAVGPTGLLYVADIAAHRVLVRLPDGRFRVVAGTGTPGFSGDGGLAVHARLSNIVDLAFSPSGSLYIADGGRVRVIDPRGVIRTVAGDGQSTTSPVRNGAPALSAALGPADGGNPLSIAVSRGGQLVIATGLSRRGLSQLLRLTGDTLTTVRAVVAAGIFKGRVVQEIGRVAVDAAGNIYTSGGYGGWVVWEITPRGAAYQVRGGPFPYSPARRSGGDYSVLERSPGGAVFAEDGPDM